MNKMLKVYLALACLVVSLALSAGSALANTAANTQIINSAKLTYTGGSANATVTVTVALVPSTPNVSITDNNSVYSGPNTPAITDTVTITATANGPALYTVTPSVFASTNVLAGSPASVSAVTPSVTIGATVTTGTSGATFVTVPAGTASGSGSAVNGIGVGSTIVFAVNSHSYAVQVTSTNDNGNGTFSINWASAIADVPPAGLLIAEQKTVNLNVLPGTVQTAGTNITVTVSASVSSPNATTANITNAHANFWTSPSLNVSFNKYVRNLSHPVTGGGQTITTTINGSSNTYYTTGVTGAPPNPNAVPATPGDTLEYVVVALNKAGTGIPDLTGCAISDQIPTNYVNFLPGAYGGAGNDIFYIDTTGATFKITAGAPGSFQASFVAANTPNLIVNVGVGANSSTTGTIPNGQQVTIAYQVVIK